MDRDRDAGRGEGESCRSSPVLVVWQEPWPRALLDPKSEPELIRTEPELEAEPEADAEQSRAES